MTPERLEEIREHNKEDRSEAGMLSMLGDSMAKEMTELLAHIDEQAEQLANVREVLKGQKAIGFREGYELAKERIGAERDRLQANIEKQAKMIHQMDTADIERRGRITALEGKLAIAREKLLETQDIILSAEALFDSGEEVIEAVNSIVTVALEQIREKEGA